VFLFPFRQRFGPALTLQRAGRSIRLLSPSKQTGENEMAGKDPSRSLYRIALPPRAGAPRLLAFAASVLLLSLGPAPALEEWADGSFAPPEGLVLWLDASRLNAARAARGLRALADGERLGVWYDASGRGRHLAARSAEAQPLFRSTSLGAAVRFDGNDDYLSLSGLALELDALALFLIAAPHSNAGGFRAFLAANETGKNDYTTGFTADLGGGGSASFETFNLEGRGFGGAADLLRASLPFGCFQLIAADVIAGAGGVRLFIGGSPEGRRDRAPGTLRLDELSVGARFFSNTQAPPAATGFLDGEIAEVLLFSRRLADAERRAVERYLLEKHARLLMAPPALASGALEDGVPLIPERPGPPGGPPVQVFSPGFTVKELPVELTNINNVRYREDGKLVALGYDGRIHVLSDRDGDGLEETIEPFWERGGLRAPIGLALLPRRGAGHALLVASKGKVSLIADTDGDGLADFERVIASGWEELPHGVDALGVALGPDGSVYFGLGCADFTNPYLIDRLSGRPGYSLASERGTILRVSPDFRSREIVATGIRFSVALAFNRHGDLFATDQEGATWLPGGNPLDELLHILPGRHYGFPPRHPSHLSEVLDEPSVYDYGPQHQSTCGLFFNETAPGRKPFGPAHWEGDALVAGYSRGKLYRTKLHKTAAGYLARNAILLSTALLAVDGCVSPDGALVLACHGGAPDWGSGPTGEGKLFKVFYRGRDLPQPVLAWAAGPLETRIAFDRPLAPALLDGLVERLEITYGEHVRAGDRFESKRPGYEVVNEQLRAPRRRLEVLAARLSPSRRTLILRTAPHPLRAVYALELRLEAGAPSIDLDYELTGVEARWEPEPGAGGGAPAWSGWLPHLDLEAALAFLEGSAERDELASLLAQPGRLELRAAFEAPAGSIMLRLESSQALRAVLGASSKELGEGGTVTLEAAAAGEPLILEVAIATGENRAGAPFLRLSYHTSSDPTERVLPLQRLVPLWTPGRPRQAPPPAPGPAPELSRGNWLRGKRIFHGEGKCGGCHQIDGEGKAVGPDLSNLVFRDRVSVLRDVLEPSASIHPDHVTYTVTLDTGAVLSGVLRPEGAERVRLVDSSGAETVIENSSIIGFSASSVSIMPEGIDEALGPEKLEDLMAYLLLPPPRVHRGGGGAPPPRRRSELEALLAGAPEPGSGGRTLRVVLVAGDKDHGPGEHEYPAWQRSWSRLLAMAEGVEVGEAWRWPEEDDLRRADVLVFYFWNHAWSEERGRELDAFLARGGGAVFIHSAVIPPQGAEGLAERIGLAWRHGGTKFRHGPLELGFTGSGGHPITRGFSTARFHDESYWPLEGDLAGITVLATGIEEGAPRPLIWTREAGRGRVFTSILGHYAWTFDDPLFRVLILRGIAWAAGEPVDRLSELASAGVVLREE
jgi:putative heme-binding domain-containing protein